MERSPRKRSDSRLDRLPTLALVCAIALVAPPAPSASDIEAEAGVATSPAGTTETEAGVATSPAGTAETAAATSPAGTTGTETAAAKSPAGTTETDAAPELETRPAPEFDESLATLVSPELWKASNRGRVPLRGDGYFHFPGHIRRVVVDVGAYRLLRTRHFLRDDDALGIVAIEPLSEPWKKWPKAPRVIGVPAAISLERGVLEFNVNEKPVTSSLLKTTENSLLSTDTVEVRKVPGVRLEDVLERIPPELEIVFLKTDVQGMDLAVLMSGGEHLRRVKEVHSEVVEDTSYEKKGVGSMSSEAEFTEYMRSMGFSVSKRLPYPEGIDAVEIFYRNDSWTEEPS